MPLFSRKRLLLASAETTYATSSAPTGTNAVLVEKLEVSPLEMEMKEREVINGLFGNRDNVVGQRMVSAKFTCELAGSGTAGTAPRYGDLLKACGCSETIVATTSVTYAPVSASFSSCTLDFYIDGGVRQLIVGARGTFALDYKVGEAPKINFEMMGLYGTPTVVANPTATYTNQAAPVAVNSDNTTTVSVHSYAACMNAFQFNVANDLVFRKLAGCSKEVIVSDRSPAGEITIELPTVTAKDYFTIASNQTKGAINLVHGTTAGNIATFNAPSTAFNGLSYEDADSVQHLKLPFRAIPSGTGNNEFTLAFT